MIRHEASAESLVAVGSLREFFRDTLQAAMSRQKLSVEGHTEQYVVNLLTVFARADALYEQTPEGPALRPLAVMLSAAMAAGSTSCSR